MPSGGQAKSEDKRAPGRRNTTARSWRDGAKELREGGGLESMGQEGEGWKWVRKGDHDGSIHQLDLIKNLLKWIFVS
jgi:hypothetical protein